MTRSVVRRNTTNEINCNKKDGHINFPFTNGIKVKVCRLFFLNTPCLGEDNFRSWVKNDSYLS